MATQVNRKTARTADEEPEAKKMDLTKDVVQVASVRADGSPDQTPNFEFIDDEVGQEDLKLKQKSLKEGKDFVREERSK